MHNYCMAWMLSKTNRAGWLSSKNRQVLVIPAISAYLISTIALFQSVRIVRKFFSLPMYMYGGSGDPFVPGIIDGNYVVLWAWVSASIWSILCIISNPSKSRSILRQFFLFIPKFLAILFSGVILLTSAKPWLQFSLIIAIIYFLMRIAIEICRKTAKLFRTSFSAPDSGDKLQPTGVEIETEIRYPKITHYQKRSTFSECPVCKRRSSQAITGACETCKFDFGERAQP
jgi:hypothetical protein